MAQIAANEEKRKMERAAVREAGREAAKQSADYIAKIERIKQRKLKELEEAGVPAKYCAECASAIRSGDNRAGCTYWMETCCMPDPQAT